jgi:hypothetical protein
VWVWFLSPLPQPGRVGSSLTVVTGAGVGAAGVVTASVVGAVVVGAAGGAEGAGVVAVPVGAGAGAGGRFGFGGEPRPPRAARVLASGGKGAPATVGAEPGAKTCVAGP